MFLFTSAPQLPSPSAVQCRTQVKLTRLADTEGGVGSGEALLSDCLALLSKKQRREEAVVSDNELLAMKFALRESQQKLEEAEAEAQKVKKELEEERQLRQRAEAGWSAAAKASRLEATREQALSHPESSQSEKLFMLKRQGIGAEGASLQPGEANRQHWNHSTSDAESACQLIHLIRQEKLIGVEIPREMQAAVSEMQATLGRALDKLSSDLYTSSSNFLNEIVQNADDNRYFGGSVPALEIVSTAENGDLWIINNEVGFTDVDVRSICDLGRSSKVQRSDGAIGRKGIGWKSVFMVSDFPHVFSGHFSFRFNALKNGKFGLILPEWVDHPERLAILATAPASRVAALNNQTVMFLPARPSQLGLQLHSTSIEPAMMIMLRRLRVLVIEDRRACTRRTLQLHQDSMDTASTLRQVVVQDEQVVNGVQAMTKHHFLVHVEAVRLSAGGASQPSASNVVLAFPSPSRKDGIAAQRPCSVFAFLPVYNAGLPFIVQADFEVAASRQQIRGDSGWNILLRGQVVIAFANAVTQNRALRENLGTFLPQEASITCPFWKPIAAEIRSILKHQAFVLTERGRLCPPKSALLRPDSLSPEFFSSDDLVRCLDLEFADASQMKRLGNDSEKLGILSFTVEHMCICLKSGKMQPALSRRPKAWFCRLFSYFQQQMTTDDIDLLYNLPIFPTKAHGSPIARDPRRFECVMVCARSQQIVSSLPAELQWVTASGAVVLIDLDPSRDASSEQEGEDAKLFLNTMGIKEATIQVLLDCILSQHWKGIFHSTTEVWQGLAFIKDNLSMLLLERSKTQQILEPRAESAAQEHSQEVKGKEASSTRDRLYLRGLDEPEATLRELGHALCFPTADGQIRNGSQLCVRGIIGVECPQCFPSQTQADGGEPNPNCLPVTFLASDRTQGLSMSVKLCRDGAGDILQSYRLACMQRHPEWETCKASMKFDGLSRFDTHVISGKLIVGIWGRVHGSKNPDWVNVGYASDGRLMIQGRGQLFAEKFVPGDVISVVVDANRRFIAFARNGRFCDSRRLKGKEHAFLRREASRAGYPDALASALIRIPIELQNSALYPALQMRNSQAEVCFQCGSDALESTNRRSCDCSLPWCYDCTEYGARNYRLAGPVDQSILGLSKVWSAHFTTQGLSLSRVVGGGFRQVAGGESHKNSQSQLDFERQWESFFVSVGLRPHMAVCQHRHWWASVCAGAAGDCAICYQSLHEHPQSGNEDESNVPDGARAVVLPVCRHKYHEGCIFEWFIRSEANHGATTCPVCRETVDQEKVEWLGHEPAAQAVSTSLTTLLRELCQRPVLNSLPNELESFSNSLGSQLISFHPGFVLLRSYTLDFLTAGIIKSTPIPTSKGLLALEEAFLEKPFKRFCEASLPFLELDSQVESGPLLEVFKSFGVVVRSDVEGLFRALLSISLSLEASTFDPPRSPQNAIAKLCGAPAAGVARQSRVQGCSRWVDIFSSIYSQLNMLVDQGSPRVTIHGETWAEHVKAVFNKERLIFDGAGQMARVSGCLWEGELTCAILGRVLLRNTYGNLRSFFCGLLDIPTLSLEACFRAVRMLRELAWGVLRDRIQTAKPDIWSKSEAALQMYQEIEDLYDWNTGDACAELQAITFDIVILADNAASGSSHLVSARSSKVFFPESKDIRDVLGPHVHFLDSTVAVKCPKLCHQLQKANFLYRLNDFLRKGDLQSDGLEVAEPFLTSLAHEFVSVVKQRSGHELPGLPSPPEGIASIDEETQRSTEIQLLQNMDTLEVVSVWNLSRQIRLFDNPIQSGASDETPAMTVTIEHPSAFLSGTRITLSRKQIWHGTTDHEEPVGLAGLHTLTDLLVKILSGKYDAIDNAQGTLSQSALLEMQHEMLNTRISAFPNMSDSEQKEAQTIEQTRRAASGSIEHGIEAEKIGDAHSQLPALGEAGGDSSTRKGMQSDLQLDEAPIPDGLPRLRNEQTGSDNAGIQHSGPSSNADDVISHLRSLPLLPPDAESPESQLQSKPAADPIQCQSKAVEWLKQYLHRIPDLKVESQESPFDPIQLADLSGIVCPHGSAYCKLIVKGTPARKWGREFILSSHELSIIQGSSGARKTRQRIQGLPVHVCIFFLASVLDSSEVHISHITHDPDQVLEGTGIGGESKWTIQLRECSFAARWINAEQ